MGLVSGLLLERSGLVLLSGLGVNVLLLPGLDGVTGLVDGADGTDGAGVDGLLLFLSNSGLVGRLSLVLPGILLLLLFSIGLTGVLLSGRFIFPLSIVLPGVPLSGRPSLFLSIFLSGKSFLRIVLPGTGLSELFLSLPLPLVKVLLPRPPRKADGCGRYILTWLRSTVARPGRLPSTTRTGRISLRV